MYLTLYFIRYHFAMSRYNLLQWKAVKVFQLSVCILLRSQLSEGIMANTQGRMSTFKESVDRMENCAGCSTAHGTYNSQAQTGWS